MFCAGYIYDRATVYAETHYPGKAEELFRLLLRLNPHDNHGVRYYLAGLYANLSEEDVDDLIEKRNHLQDWSELEDVLETQNQKHHFWEWVEAQG